MIKVIGGFLWRDHSSVKIRYFIRVSPNILHISFLKISWMTFIYNSGWWLLTASVSVSVSV